MLQEVTHIYFVPGMAADVSIFENIKLAKEKYAMHMIPWKLPKNKETITEYAKRMCQEIKHKKSVLIGVSFGGIMVQEMSKHLDLRKLIIISSVKTKHELPKRMKVVRKTKAYKLFPTGILSRINDWEKLAFGEFAKKRAAMYQKYLSVNDKHYLDWAIKNVVCWDQDQPIPGLVHIHGDKDLVFPIGHIENCIILENGTHAMIINRARWFNERLPQIIEDNYS